MLDSPQSVDELQEIRARIDAGLERFLPSPDRVPESLCRAMRYSLFPGGKRLRPLLTMAASRTLGGKESLAIPAACAIEMIHSYSLVHDDLPAMDNDDLRRGRPTSHRKFGEALAILSGDALLSLAFQILARHPEGESNGPLRLRVLQLIADAASAEGIIAGQVMDMETEGQPFTEQKLVEIHRHKTGVLINASVVSGAMAAGADETALGHIRAYGEAIGLAFQIVDDLLDVEGTTETLGKSTGKDARAAKATFPALLGLEASRRRAGRLVERARQAIRHLSPGTTLLDDIAGSILKRTH